MTDPDIVSEFLTNAPDACDSALPISASKPIDLKYTHMQSLHIEIDLWFSASEALIISHIQKNSAKSLKSLTDSSDWQSLSPDLKLATIDALLSRCRSSSMKSISLAIQALSALLFGLSGTYSSLDELISSIRNDVAICLTLPTFLDTMTLLISKHTVSTLNLQSLHISSPESTKTIHLSRGVFFSTMSILYVTFQVLLHSDQPKPIRYRQIATDILSSLIRIMADACAITAVDIPLQQLFLLLNTLIQYAFGDFEDLEKSRSLLNELNGVSQNQNSKSDLSASLFTYNSFRHQVTSKYPILTPPANPILMEILEGRLFTAPSSQLAHNSDSQTGPSQHLSSQSNHNQMDRTSGGPKIKKGIFQTNQDYPFLFSGEGEAPASIKEACELLNSSLYMSASQKQIIDEKILLHKWNINQRFKSELPKEVSKMKCTDDYISDTLDLIESLYASSLRYLPSMVAMILDSLLTVIQYVDERTAHHSQGNGAMNYASDDAIRSQDIVLRSISEYLLLFLKWSKRSHVLKFEYMATLLVESRALRILSQVLFREPPAYFLLASTRPNSVWLTSVLSISNITASRLVIPEGDDGYCSWLRLTWAVDFLRIMHKLIKQKAFRLVRFASSRTDHTLSLSHYLFVDHPDLRKYALKIFKAEMAFHGRKWRQHNMSIISDIYVNSDFKLGEPWLAIADTSNTARYQQSEENYKQLTNFYLVRMYPEQTEGAVKFGYRSSD
ncbi:hypothetical protein CANCADRAFT_56851 [Tortispora caseinolytica NRRL Y-17796]|uniref:Uncharacterized protein n=1 Tax=Tortispora caseinolytica NRRL Y-17796 TaxID=767744 RepID=A0A1E4TF39_9ASCO|nr:hypothetical protein CANCADRAFT_56851 [Tortispora caseinolytica NRRL Y-17796]